MQYDGEREGEGEDRENNQGYIEREKKRRDYKKDREVRVRVMDGEREYE